MQCVVDALAKSRGPLSAAELEEQVLAGGYKTRSKRIRQMIYTQVGKDARIARASRGVFQLAAAGKAAK